MAKKAKKGSKKAMRINFGGVDKEIRKRAKKIPEGDYLFKITKGEVKKNKSGDGKHILFSVQVVEDGRGNTKYAGVPNWYRCSLKPDALFNLRNMIFAASDGKKNVAGKAIDFDPTSLVGKRIAGTVEDSEYEGRTKSELVTVFPPSELVEEEEEDEDDDEEEDDEEEEEEEDDEDDEDEEEDEDDEEEDDLDDVDDDDL